MGFGGEVGSFKGFRWVLAPVWDAAAEAARRLKISPLMAQLLHNRGIDDADEITAFLDPKLTRLHPPESLPGVVAAAERLARAARDGERICIYGDYDVDGMTAVAVLYRLLKPAGADVDYYVPHRLDEGYGVNVEAIEAIAEGGAKLLVTVDCGVSAVGPLARAKELGLDVIVTDHHEPGEALPDVLAIVHPGLPGGGYANPGLSGSGVALKLAWQTARLLCGSDRVDEATRNYLIEATSLAALGIIADVVPLVGENRILAAYGLRGLAAIKHPGIRALLRSARLVGEKLDSVHVGFRLAPRLNAAGRMGHANLAVELLARPEEARCAEIADYLEKQNAERRKVEREITREAAERVEAGRTPAPTDHAIVLAGEGWHAGVVGIVASRMVDRFGRPAVMIALDGDAGQGSARSIDGFHMRDALDACSEHLTGFGGHAMAAGMQLPAANVPAFAEAFAAYAAECLTDELLTPALRIDVEASLGDLDYRAIDHMTKLEPFGRGNPKPIVAVRGVEVLSPPQRMGRDGNTVGFIVGPPGGGKGGRVRCVGFGMGDLVDELAKVKTIDIAGEPTVNHYMGRSSVEMHLKDVRLG